MLRSQPCSKQSLTSHDFLAWADLMRPAWDFEDSGRPVLVHRKMWEWLFIAQALGERGVLRPGTRGLGFGVGQEPLVALFARFGCEVVATDMPQDAATEAGWTSDGQFASDISLLNQHGLCSPDLFAHLVRFRTVDMNELPKDLRGFDFSWSACAFEHLGSLEKGLQFVERQMACLRPGGVSVHTTEFNVDSDDETVSDGGTVLYRKRDLVGLARRLRRRGHGVWLRFGTPETPDDRHVDVPPYSDIHLRIRVGQYTTTSYGLIVRKRAQLVGSIVRP